MGTAGMGPRAVGAAAGTPPSLAPLPFPGTDQVDPARVFRASGYTSPAPSRNGVAQVALWLSVAFLVPLPPLLAVSAALGGIAWIRAGGRGGAGLRAARGAVAISASGIALWGLLVLLIWTA
ncbi:MAG: hypothetical protein LKI27_03890 [Actinomyces sp.]|nr:hypothetical protein [Actinomyces sp.]MCI1662026.1 hypothetical protein [Actinomyces sp.]MCI1690774.1 hypothetical protein [Actinomyces sp.]